MTTVNFNAFTHLASTGRVVFLLDSFDEMAQTIRPSIIRENLSALLVGVSNGSKAIMTSRPTYFESRAERLVVVDRDGRLAWEDLDEAAFKRSAQLAQTLAQRIQSTSFARLNDLTSAQRKALFDRILAHSPNARAKLNELFTRFESLESVSQRAVIARMLTSVAETLADGQDPTKVIPSNATSLNEADVFQIVVQNLLTRDQNFGGLNFAQRRAFLRSFAVRLQQRGRSLFASPAEILTIVETLFASSLSRSDTPGADLDNYYRTCRRHSGLTTERQFADTSGAIDSPVDERDLDSPVGFSHNSLREFLVADALIDHLKYGNVYEGLSSAVITETVANFCVGLVEYDKTFVGEISKTYQESHTDKKREWIFRLLLQLVRNNVAKMEILGTPCDFRNLDLSGLDLSGLDLGGADFSGSLLAETNLTGTNLRHANFQDASLERIQLDGARLEGSDFSSSDLISIFVNDTFSKKTIAVLQTDDARQWLYISAAVVANPEGLNPFLGKPWYEASKEVANTICMRIAGTHKRTGLARGTKQRHREDALAFVDYLIKRHIVDVVLKGKKAGGDVVVQLRPEYRKLVSDFAERGVIGEELHPFFEPLLARP